MQGIYTDYTADMIKQMTKDYLIDTYERFDFVATRAEGMYLYDENGDGYLDFYGGIAVSNAGNKNKKVVDAICRQANEVIHTFNYPYTAPQALLGKKICDSVGMDKIFFQNSGAEANEAMIKLARKYGIEKYGEHKYEIITAYNSFHGRSYGALSATGQPESACHRGFGPLLPGFQYAQFNNIESFAELCSENTIAIMIELVQGEGGVYPADENFISQIVQLCRKRNLLLLVDEVQTGWGRTGELMCYQKYGISPDIVTMGKGMGGGMPIAAVCSTAEIAKAFTPGSHGATYGGNPVCCAAAYAQINEIIDMKLCDNCIRMSEYLVEQLKNLPDVKEIRASGLLIGIEFKNVQSIDIKHMCLANKLIVTSIGEHIIRLTPPLVITKIECDKAVEILRQIVQELV